MYARKKKGALNNAVCMLPVSNHVKGEKNQRRIVLLDLVKRQSIIPIIEIITMLNSWNVFKEGYIFRNKAAIAG